MGLLVALSSLTLFQSYNYMAAGIASTLLFVYRSWWPWSWLFSLKRNWRYKQFCVSCWHWVVLPCFTRGRMVRCWVWRECSCYASALSYAIYIVAVNRPLLREIATLKLTFYVLVFGLSLFLVRVDFGASLRVVDTWYLWGNLVALAVFPTAISFLCTTQAIQYIGSTPTAILWALEPLQPCSSGDGFRGGL